MIREFPYTNLHDLNIDWILNIVEDFKARYQNLDESFQSMLQQIITAGNNAIEAINNDEETAIQQIGAFKLQCIQALQDERTVILTELQNVTHNQIDAISEAGNHQIGLIDQDGTSTLSAISSAGAAQVNIINRLITSLPQTYEDCVNQLQIINSVLNQTYNYPPLVQGHYDDPYEDDDKTLVADALQVSSLISAGCASRDLSISITSGTAIIRKILWWSGWGNDAVIHRVNVPESTTEYNYTFDSTATYFSVAFAYDNHASAPLSPSDFSVEFDWQFTALDNIEINEHGFDASNTNALEFVIPGNTNLTIEEGTEVDEIDISGGNKNVATSHKLKDTKAREDLDKITEVSDNQFYFTNMDTRTLGSVSDPTKRVTVEFPTKSSIKVNGELNSFQYIGIMGGSDERLGYASYTPDAYSGNYAATKKTSGSVQFSTSNKITGLRYGDNGATGTAISNGSVVTLDNKYFSFRLPAGIYTDYVIEYMLVEGEKSKPFVPYGDPVAVDIYARADVKEKVSYAEAQTLTDAQQTQARTNIGASSAASDAEKVSYAEAQTLTDTQKTQARTNIGALGTDSASANMLISKCDLVTPKKIITWIDDDTSSVSAIESVMTICETLGIRCTFATITHNWTSAIITKLLAAQDAGYHIASHGHSSHTFWRESNALALDGDLSLSIREMQQAGFIDSDMFVYPGGSVDRQDVDVPSVIAKWCRCGVKDYLNSAYCTGYGQGRYKINRKFIDKSSHSSISYYTNLLGALSEDSAPWYVYGTHSSHSSEFDADLVSGVLSYALQDGWTIMTLNQAYKYRERYYMIQELFGLN